MNRRAGVRPERVPSARVLLTVLGLAAMLVLAGCVALGEIGDPASPLSGTGRRRAV